MDTIVVYSPAPGPGGGAYTQNFVDSNGTGDVSNSTYGGNEAAMTLSVWLRPNVVASALNIFSVSGRSLIACSTGRLRVRLVDTGNNVCYDQLSSGTPFVVGQLVHLYIAADFANDTLVIEVDGAALTMEADPSTFASTSGLVDFDRATNFVAAFDAEVADFAVFNAIVSNSALYNGGTPPDPAGFSPTPRVLLGSTMLAADWNAGTNLGAGGAMTVVSGTFTDV